MIKHTADSPARYHHGERKQLILRDDQKIKGFSQKAGAPDRMKTANTYVIEIAS